MLFSATQTREVKDLARMSFTTKPTIVAVHEERAVATADGLEQG